MREGLRVIGVGMHRTYDYFGGIRTVDVHVRRPRARLGVCESMIGTVRQVGYKFVTQPARPR